MMNVSNILQQLRFAEKKLKKAFKESETIYLLQIDIKGKK